MIFKKYVLAIGIALGFLVTSLSAADSECPVGADMNKISKSCKRTLDDLNKLPEGQQSDNYNEVVKKYKDNFYGDSTCETVKVAGHAKTHARCKAFENQDDCEKEQTACKWSAKYNECTARKSTDINFGCFDTGSHHNGHKDASHHKATGDQNRVGDTCRALMTSVDTKNKAPRRIEQEKKDKCEYYKEDDVKCDYVPAPYSACITYCSKFDGKQEGCEKEKSTCKWDDSDNTCVRDGAKLEKEFSKE